MYIVHRPQTDPWFNLAAEEYLLKTFDQDCFMLWRNEPAIIIGKHQNAFAEINPAFVDQHNIPVIRRISGGGTVFHDPGNVNFSFITKGETGKLVDFRKFIDPLIHSLNSLGVPAQFEGKNDIRVNGLKISGNAEHVYKNKVLHHGTLLYDSKLNVLAHAIRVREGIFKDKAVQSNRSKVTNIIDYLENRPDVTEFIAMMEKLIKESLSFGETYDLTHADMLGIKRLANEKYKSWEWNYAYSPPSDFERKIKINDNWHELKMRIEKGIIVRIELIEAFPAWDELFNHIRGEKFDPSYLISMLKNKLLKAKWDENFLRHWITTLFY